MLASSTPTAYQSHSVCVGGVQALGVWPQKRYSRAYTMSLEKLLKPNRGPLNIEGGHVVPTLSADCTIPTCLLSIILMRHRG